MEEVGGGPFGASLEEGFTWTLIAMGVRSWSQVSRLFSVLMFGGDSQLISSVWYHNARKTMREIPTGLRRRRPVGESRYGTCRMIWERFRERQRAFSLFSFFVDGAGASIPTDGYDACRIFRERTACGFLADIARAGDANADEFLSGIGVVRDGILPFVTVNDKPISVETGAHVSRAFQGKFVPEGFEAAGRDQVDDRAGRRGILCAVLFCFFNHVGGDDHGYFPGIVSDDTVNWGQ